jgi:hypothetical protein
VGSAGTPAASSAAEDEEPSLATQKIKLTTSKVPLPQATVNLKTPPPAAAKPGLPPKVAPSGGIAAVPSGKIAPVPSGKIAAVPSGKILPTPSGKVAAAVPTGKILPTPSGKVAPAISGKISAPSGKVAAAPDAGSTASMSTLESIESASEGDPKLNFYLGIAAALATFVAFAIQFLTFAQY